MYENLLKKFFKHNNVEIMLYLSRAYFSAGKLKEAKLTLLKARKVAPQDHIFLFNNALVLQRLATQTLKDDKSVLSVVLQVVHKLGLSHKYFTYLAQNAEKTKLNAAPVFEEANKCKNLLS